MLEELNIRNFAIIDKLELRFQEGLNILTGETGAGKSIIIGAIQLVLGGKASADQIRSRQEEAVVEALFQIEDRKELKKLLESRGYVPGEKLLIKRILTRGGRSRAYINGQLATLQILSEIGREMVNIYGQHEHQSMLQPDRHIDLLDEFGGLMDFQKRITALYENLLESRKHYQRFAQQIELGRQQRELWEFQLKEIESARLKEGEDRELEEERKLLANAQRLYELAALSEEELYSSESSAMALVDRSCKRLAEMAAIDPSLKPHEEALNTICFQLEDIGREINRYQKDIPFDTQRLEEIERRLEEIRRLKRKYGHDLCGILELADRLKKELVKVTDGEERLEELKNTIQEQEAILIKEARVLSERRREAARRLSRRIEHELEELGFQGVRFSVRQEAGMDHEAQGAIQCGPKGVDMVEFHLSTVPGEPLKPLLRVASGGELSRIMLAIKKALAEAGRVPTLVFDEIDSGIGGATAQIVGRKLKDVSKNHQVFCITHLPQIACYGETHYLVRKRRMGTRTDTEVRMLKKKERIDEIARMLAGEKITSKTRDHAVEMLEMAER